ncbi:MAG: Asp23/Gls24 family envelope stress response protein [Oscillospiraceae bacterium]|nr:Asp23/Gls24 family envelope stress response protein [Oscillospiraceae bacterium]
MPENKDYIFREEELGNIQVSEEVLAAITGAAALEVEGVAGLSLSAGSDMTSAVNRKTLSKSVRLSMEDGRVDVTVSVLVKYGHVVPDVAKEVQEVVKSAMENTSGLKVSAVNVVVTGIAFPK